MGTVKDAFDPSPSFSIPDSYLGCMTSGVSRMGLLTVVAATLLVVSGCAAVVSPSTTPHPTTVNGTDELTFPDPPDSLTRERAGQLVTQYHLALLAERLGGNGTTPEVTLPPRRAVNPTVINRSEGGYYAAIDLSAANGSLWAPRYDRAMYLVTVGTSPQSANPVQVMSVDPYVVAANTVPPVDLRLVNFAPSQEPVTVVVTRLGSPVETAYVGRYTLESNTGVLLEETLAASGSYRVTATTANRSTSRIIRYDGTTPERPIGVYLDPDGSIGIYRGPT